MLHLKLVKTPEAEDPNIANEGMLHGTAVMKYLVEPWAHTGQLVVGDSYFASIGASQVLYNLGLQFIGIAHQDSNKRIPHGISCSS
jgi:Transposase IS4